MSVSTILGGKGRVVVTASPKDKVEVVVRLLAEKKIGAVVVVSPAGAIMGIVSERDIVRHLASDGPGMMAMAVDSVMTKNVRTAREQDTEAELMTLMTDHRIRHLPVVTNGRLTGMVSIGDVVKHRIAMIERETEDIKAYIAGAA
jgi:CBS domain-containing protein